MISARQSKYPPAKPGALEREPLKAAGKAAYAAYTLINGQGSGKSVNAIDGALPQLLPWPLSCVHGKPTTRKDAT